MCVCVNNLPPHANQSASIKLAKEKREEKREEEKDRKCAIDMRMKMQRRKIYAHTSKREREIC